jgi:hypothetical protein
MREVFEDLCVEYNGANTALTGELDQAALHGVLNRILAFRLELVALSRLDDEPERRPEALAHSEGVEPQDIRTGVSRDRGQMPEWLQG